jgi:molecular chaperone GrpE
VAKKTEQQEPDSELETPASGELKGEAVEDEIDQLRNELAQALADTKTHQDQYLRTLADMDNLRKRTQRDKEEMAKFANEHILREILPVIDNLERAVEHAEQAESNDGLFEGVQMTLTQFGQLLSKFGVKHVDAVGLPFDPAYHQAMGQMESEDYPINTVVQQMQKGYQLNQRLLRPAFVLLAKAPVTIKNEDNEGIGTIEEKDED